MVEQEKSYKYPHVINLLNKTFETKTWCRKIQVTYVNGKKIPKGEDSSAEKQQIINKIPPEKGFAQFPNNYSLYVKYYNNENSQLVVVDFDEKNDKVYNSKLWKLMKDSKTVWCETNKGFHFYCKFNYLPNFSNETKISSEGVDIDLLKGNKNIWEPFDREFHGDCIKEFNWNNGMAEYFDFKKMSISNDRPVDRDKEIERVDNEREFINKEDIKIPKCSQKEFMGYVERLDESRFTYDSWTKIAYMCFNNFDGDELGLDTLIHLTKMDINYKRDHSQRTTSYISDMWKRMGETETEKFISYKTLRKWADTDKPQNKFKVSFQIDGKEGILEEMNKELAFNVETSEYLLFYDDDKWGAKKRGDIINHYKNKSFVVPKEAEEKKDKVIDPFEIWENHELRRTYKGIVFDPTDSSPEYFNLWNGYAMNPDTLIQANADDSIYIQNHILDIWCRGNQEHCDYVLNWMAHKLQKPHIKICVVVALQSKEGAGKNCVLNKFEKILGRQYHATISNINQIVGDFNGFIEGKMFIVLDELIFGGDHKMNNRLKNIITETCQVVNKKNKESYQIDNYADYFITTNMKHFIGVTEQSRRYFCLQCDDKYSGIQTTEKKEYFKKILETPEEAFAKFLYERDISKFNPREFAKTDLFQAQNEKSWPSDIKFIYKCLESNSLSASIKWNSQTLHYFGKRVGNKFFHKLDDLFELYTKADLGAYASVVPLRDFEQSLYDVFSIHITKKITKGQTVISLPDIDIARKCFNSHQDYNYTFGSGLQELESDSEEEE